MIRIKILSKVRPEEWLRYFPKGEPIWGDCRFEFNQDCRNYDWLVVYDDLPSNSNVKKDIESGEDLPCPRSQTLLVTTEPSSIKCYGTSYTSQFGHVLTSQEPWALAHPNRIYSQTGLRWFYGVGQDHIRSWDELVSYPPTNKSRLISAASSGKRQRHTLHYKRFSFVKQLSGRLPDLDVFGRGIRPMDDKAEALDPYFFHIAIENHIGPHHWTEKLSDAFLGMTLPFYSGAPNAVEYFPAESFIPIDIHNPEESYRMILDTIRSGAYQHRLPYIREARDLVLNKYHLIAVLSDIIGNIGLTSGERGFRLRSRHTLRKSHPGIALQVLGEKIRQRILCTLKT
jgi:hypothetical protein